MRFAKRVTAFLVVCLLMMGCTVALADAHVSFLLPINYFCIDEDQTVSTQEQLNDHSKDGLVYEFTDDGQILCTVTDQDAALQAVIHDMETTFAEAQDPENSMYAKSFRKLEYNTDLSEIKVICNKDEWGFLDSFYGMFFLANARDYQLYSGVAATDLRSEVQFVDESGEVLYTDNLAEYMDVGEENNEADTEEEIGEPSSVGDGLMPYDQVLRLIKWIDDGYFKNRTYEEFVAFTGVEGRDMGHKDTSMTTLGDHYFDWIADSDPTHFIHVCFRGRDDSGRFEANQWNTSGFASEEWGDVDLTDWLKATACHDVAETSLEIQRFSNPLVTVTVQMPVVGWNTRVNSNTAYFYNERGESTNDPRIEVITYDDPAMFDFYLDQYENVQPADSRVIAGVEMQGRTYHTSGWDWSEYSAQLSEKVSICVRISRINCNAGTEGGMLLDSMQLSWTEQDGTAYVFPGSEPLSTTTAEPEPAVTTEPVPAPTEMPAPTETAEPVLTDEFAPNDPIEFAAMVTDRPESWQEYAFTNRLNGITLTFCIPMDAEKAVTAFYENKEPRFTENNGRAFFNWKYETAENSGSRMDISQIYPTGKEHEIKSLMGHNADGNVYTTIKTDRGFTIYRKVNDCGEARWAIVSDPLSDGTRVLALVEAANKGRAGETWYEAIMQAFEGSVQLNVPGEVLGVSDTVVEISAETPVPEMTEEPAVETPAPTPIPEAPATAMPENPAVVVSEFVGTWYSTWLNTGVMEGDPRDQFGFTIILTLNADGSGDLDYLGSDGGGTWGMDEDGIVRYWGEGTSLSILEDGSLCWGTAISGYILFSQDPNAEAQLFPENVNTQIITDAMNTPVPQVTAEASDHTTSAGSFVGVKYVGKTYTAGGVSMDASMLGGEYAIQLNADGTALFTMAGMDVPGYSWKQVEDHIDVDAYGTVLMTLTLQEDGTMLMDYSGAFTLLMEPKE